MKLKQLVLMGGLVALFTHTHTQAQQTKWVVHNSIVNPVNGQVNSNPLGSNPDHSQNAIWDQNGNLKIYAEDGFIYNSTGQQLVPDPSYAGFWYNPNNHGHSEFVFVPVPGQCDKFYSFSVDELVVGSEGEGYDGNDVALVYSIIDLNLNNGQGGVEPILVPIIGQLVVANWLVLDPGRAFDYHRDKYHIGVTKMQLNGKRYLFVSGAATLRIYEISTNGIMEIAEGIYPLWGNRYVRSELEIYEDDDFIIVAIPELSHVQPTPTSIYVYYAGIDIISFRKPHANGGLVFEDYEQKILSYPNNDVAAIKGIEFSPNGEFLYVTRVLKKDGEGDQWVHPSSVVPTTDLIFFERNIAGLPRYDKIPFPFGAVQLNEQDFSFGMLEVDKSGSLILAGDNRLGRLEDANNPNSSFDPNYIEVPNLLTQHGSVYDIRKVIRLLPDQVDGEDLLDYYYTDQFPETLYVCDLPYVATSGFVGDWYLGFWPSVYLGSGLTMNIPNEGVVTIQYRNNNGCNVVESFYLMKDPVAQFGSGFTFTTSNPPGVLNINLTSLVTFGASHIWTLQMSISGSWVSIGTSFITNPQFSNLDASKQYKVKHEILPVMPYNCMFNNISSQVIN